MNELFKLPSRLPESARKIPMYRATRHESMSSRDGKYARDLGRRLQAAKKAFGIDAEPSSEGARLVMRSDQVSLELYTPSDSLWWTDHRLAYQEQGGGASALPDDKKALKIAAEHLARSGLDASAARVASVTPVEVGTRSGDGKPRSARTALDVNYAFSLGEAPVVGPGAKVKVTLAGDGALAQLVYFWRQPAKAPSASAIGAAEAVERFMRDPAFFHLRNKDATVEVRSVTFAYYAMTPTDFQRLYVPVWAIDATCRTRELRHDFRRHVVAIDMTPEQAKRADVVANPRACRMF